MVSAMGWPAEGVLRINPMRSPEGKEALRIANVSSSPTLLHLNKQEDGSIGANVSQRGKNQKKETGIAVLRWRKKDHLL